MKKTLVIMAAGLGSRFGAGQGQKQITPVDENGHLIIDYSAYDAMVCGFEKVVFVIQPESREQFHRIIGANVSRHMEISYSFQTMGSCLPAGFAIPTGREKPWGTGHAALCSEEEVPDGFVCINADDFYGRSAFEAAAHFLDSDQPENRHAMVGYELKNTVTPNGSVARGVCETDKNGLLKTITERTKIVADGEDARYTDDDKHYTHLSGKASVSMNFWIFHHSIYHSMHEGFERFLRERMPLDPLRQEFYLPDIPDSLIKSGKAEFVVLPTKEKWFGLTYLNDLPATRDGVKALREKGLYPEKLW